MIDVREVIRERSMDELNGAAERYFAVLNDHLAPLLGTRTDITISSLRPEKMTLGNEELMELSIIGLGKLTKHS
jgi:hypothetical protein